MTELTNGASIDRWTGEERIGDWMIRFRSLRQSDRDEVLKGFRRLSSRSRYLRFLSPKSALEEDDLSFFRDLEGGRQLAMIAVRLDSEGSEVEGVALARCCRSPEDPSVAEPAVTVVDSWQRKGIGGKLLRRLASAAAAAGVNRFRSYILTENESVWEMVRKVFPDASRGRMGEISVVEFSVVDQAGSGTSAC